MISEEDYMLVVNAANIDRDFDWMQKHRIDGVTLTDRSDEIAKLDLQGPKSRAILTSVISDAELQSLERFHFYFTEYMGAELIISNSGYTGEKGYELYIASPEAVELWRAILEAGSGHGLIPVGLGARDSLRIEACYSLYGHEINDSTTPVEGGIGWLLSSDRDYTAKEIVMAQKKAGAPREIVCLEMVERGIPREGYRIEQNGTDLGHVTSGVFSPLMKKGIAMGIVKKGAVKTGDEVSVVIRDKGVQAKIVQRPFYSYNA
jgi:aminomethyltransferase